MKVLIIRFSSIGDIVLTTPVIRCLKKQVPGITLHYLTKDAFATIVESNPYADKVIRLSHSWELMMHELAEEEYDFVIDLHNNIRSLRVKRQLDVRSSTFNKLNIRKWIYVNFKINMMPDVHIVDRYLDAAESFGIRNDGEGLDYFIPEHDKITEEDLPVSHHAGYIGIAIGAAHATKKLPVDKLRELCMLINHPIVLLGGKEDFEAANEIAGHDPVKIYNACGKFTLNESADIVRRSKMMITHDTGLMHIAAAFRKPIISVWGNTVPSFGMTPYYGNFHFRDQRFQVNKLPCRPCSKIGYEKCPRGHFKCMRQIDLEEIARTVKSFT